MKAGKIGALAAALASACCVGPLLLAALGLGSLGLGTALGRYHWVLQGAAVVGLTLAWYLFLREKRRMYALASEMRNERTTRRMLSAATAIVVAFLGLNLYTAARAGLSTPAALEEARAGQKAVSNQAAAAGALIRLPVEGMSCYTCELSVESKLKGLPGVLEARASAPDKSVTVRYDPRRVTLRQMVQAVGAAGYQARLPQDGSGRQG